MSIRRSQRAGGAHVSGGVTSALESMRRMKREGKRRLDDYEVNEAAPVYDEVDEEEYAQITAQKRKETREFLVAEDEGGEDIEVVDDDLQAEFEYEDEESFLPVEGGEKKMRKRRRDPLKKNVERRRKSFMGSGEGKQRLSAAYYKLGVGLDGGSGVVCRENGNDGGVDVENGEFLLDSLMEAEMEAMASDRKRMNRRVRAVPQIDEMLRSGMSTAKLRQALAEDAPEQKHRARGAAPMEELYTDPPPMDFSELPPQPRSALEVVPQEHPQQEPTLACGTGVRQPAATSAQPLQGTRAQIESVPPGKNHGRRAELSLDVNPPDVFANVIDEDDEGGREPESKESLLSTRVMEPVVSDTTRPSTNALTAAPLKDTRQNIAFDADGSLLVYWIDAHEVHVNGGESVYLFGKVPLGTVESSTFASVCIQVGGLERAMYFVPREVMLDDEGNATETAPRMIEDVHEEVTDLLFREAKVSEVKAKVVTRSYPFGDCRAPYEPTQCLKVKYPMSYPSLSPSTEGKSFSAVIGARTSAIERLLVRRGIMGPCWLRINNASKVNDRLALTRFYFSTTNPKDISVCDKQREPPTLTVLAINICTQLNPRTGAHEVVMASGCHLPNVPVSASFQDEAVSASSTYTVLCPPDQCTLPKGFVSGVVETVPNEGVLLNFFLAKVLRIEPDVLVGHDLMGGIVETLMSRMSAKGTRDWSRLGRLVQRRNLSSITGNGKKAFAKSAAAVDAIAGRLPCDIYIQSKELLTKEKDYSLPSLAEAELEVRIQPICSAQVRSMYSSVEQLSDLVKRSEVHAQTALRMAFHLSILPLTKQLTNLSGNVWSRTLRGARAERIELLLCHELTKRSSDGTRRVKYLIPDKLRRADRTSMKKHGYNGEVERKKKGPQYAGGLVLEPKKGLYDQYIIQLDFNSLYPSIIQEYNICFTTVRPADGQAQLPESSLDEGILPRVLRRMVEQRRAVKSHMQSERNPVLRKQLETRQLAIKLTANSIYGCLGFENSRFFARPLAELITAQGRDTLQRTVELAQEKQMEVVYGDTDSLFINTGLDELAAVVARGSDLKREVNRRYRTLEIEVDAVYAKMLLLRKKKYAAMRVQNLLTPDKLIREVKGLDLVRHDWSDLSHDVSEYALQQLLGRGIRIDDAIANLLNFLTTTAERVRANAIPLGKYIITKSLTKMPEDYPDAKNLPHVQVALRSKKFGKYFRTGDYVKYVICKKLEGGDNSLPGRAFHPEEVMASHGKLQIDVEWYLGNQILPPINRLCEPIEGVEITHLAEAMGLESKRYYNTVSGENQNDDANNRFDVEQTLSGVDRFAQCEEWVVKCSACGHVSAFKGIHLENGRVVNWGLSCSECNELLSEGSLRAQLHAQLREWIKKYYLSPLLEKNDDGKLRQHRNPRLINNSSTNRHWSSQWLYLQFRYILWILDPQRGLEQICPSVKSEAGRPLTTANVVVGSKKEDPVVREVYFALSRQVERLFRKNAYRYIDLADMLSTLGVQCK